MCPANKRIRIKFFAWMVAATVFIVCASVGSAYGRISDWDSTEWIYSPAETPSPVPTHSSDCLVEGGQAILLKDWQPSENQREILMTIQRPEADIPAVAEEPLPEDTEAPEPDEGETVPDEDPFAGEVTVQPDATVALHLTAEAQVTEDAITLRLTRVDPAPGLAQATRMTVHVQWYGLEGTLQFSMLPYGDEVEAEGVEEPAAIEREIVPDLIPFSVNDTIDPANSLAYVRLNPETKADFTVSLLLGNEALYKVRWSLNGGETYSLLYDSHILSIAWPYPEGWDGTVVLDFSEALAAGQGPTIAVEATDYPRKEYTPALSPAPVLPRTHVITGVLPATMLMPTRWGAAQVQARSIQRLIKNEQGEYVYTDDTALAAVTTDAGIWLEPAADGVAPVSGSYRMTLHWVWNGISLQEHTLYFFINSQ